MKWRRVEDELPLAGVRVLVFLGDGRREIATRELGFVGWYRDLLTGVACFPTHWMPLPPPPGADE